MKLYNLFFSLFTLSMTLTIGKTISLADVTPKVDTFETVCGVIVEQENSSYPCQVIDKYNDDVKAMTELKFPDNELQLIWKSDDKVEVQMDGLDATFETTYSTYEGETNFVIEGKTYYYYSNKELAEIELRNFKE